MLLLLIAAASTSVFAAFQSISRSTVTAGVKFTLAGQVSMSIQLMNLNGGTTTQIWWDPAQITIGQTQWRRADAYILLNSTITAATGGIQIYTDNKASDANPQYTGTGNPAGLVAQEDTSATPLSMCWRITDVSTTTLTIRRGAPGYPDRLWAQELGDQYPCFLWMKDKNTPGFQNGEDYVTVKEAARGLHHSEGDWGTGVPSPDYIYIGADFTNALTPRTYKTSTLRLEAFTE